MTEIITLAAVAVIALVIGWIGWRDRRRRRGGGALSGMLSVADNVFHPEAARAVEIREIQQELPVPSPVPGDRSPE